MRIKIVPLIFGVGGLMLIAYNSNMLVSVGVLSVLFSHLLDCH